MLKKFKKLILIILIVFITFLSSGCSNKIININNLDDLKDKNVGIYVGSEYDRILTDKINNVNLMYYNNYNDLILSLKNNKIDAFLTDEPLAKEILKKNNELKILEEKLTKDSYAFAINPKSIELKKDIDNVILEMKNDGTLDKFINKWMTEENYTLEKYDYNSKKAIKFATVSGSAPFSFMKDNKIVGYDIDVINYIGYKLNYNVEIIEMAFEGIIPAVSSGKIDLAGCSIIVTEDRKKSVLFSEPDYTGGIVVITNNNKENSTNVWQSIYRTIFEENRYVLLIRGLINTIIISIFSIIIGSILGIIICYLGRCKNKFLSLLIKGFINIMQGIPITLLLLVFYYVIFAKVDINALIISIITFSIYFSVYVSEIVKSALESINESQIQSAYSLGFSRFETLKYVIIPQSLAYIIPVYKNEVVSLIKLTSICGYISIIDLTRASDLIRNRTYEAFLPLIITAIMYYFICFVVGKLLDLVYKKYNYKKDAGDNEC